MDKFVAYPLIVALLVAVLATSCAVTFGGNDQQAREIEGLDSDLNRFGAGELEAVPEDWSLFHRGRIDETSLDFDILRPESSSPDHDHVIVCLSRRGENARCEPEADPDATPLRLDINSDIELLAWCYDGEPLCEAEALPKLAESWSN